MIDQNGWGNGRCSWDGVVTLRAIKESDAAVHATASGKGGKARVEWNGANFWDDNQVPMPLPMPMPMPTRRKTSIG